MDKVRQFRFDRIRARQFAADHRYEQMREARENATSQYHNDPTEKNRQAVLVAVRATIEALEDLYSLDLHVAALAKGVDPEWDRLAEDGIQATEIRLNLNYHYLLPGGNFGFTLGDL